MKLNILKFSVLIVVLIGCKKKNDLPIIVSPIESSDMVALISNEGPFMSGTGTISLINFSNQTVQNNLFEEVNGFPLGNIVQSTLIHDDMAFIVVNNAAKIEVVNYPSFESIATINGLVSPRYCIASNNLLYVSDWGTGGVAVVDLNTFQIVNQIATGNGPEKLMIAENKLFVANAGNWTNTDNHVTVISLSSNSVIHQIETGDSPNSMVIDADGDLRVLCSGINDWANPDNNTAGALLSINIETYEVMQTISFEDINSHPANLTSNVTGTELFYLLNSNAYSLNLAANQIPTTAIIEGNYYAMGYHNTLTNLLLCDAVDFSQNGKVYTFSETGLPIDTFNVGVIPGNVFTR